MEYPKTVVVQESESPRIYEKRKAISILETSPHCGSYKNETAANGIMHKLSRSRDGSKDLLHVWQPRAWSEMCFISQCRLVLQKCVLVQFSVWWVVSPEICSFVLLVSSCKHDGTIPNTLNLFWEGVIGQWQWMTMRFQKSNSAALCFRNFLVKTQWDYV